ncbi:ABC transporter ATP-binding protein [Salinibius halmophilus]|uniref:ABC transporter ATP-binding protein n=1 Tax=Salinibius halmophilus TaxID=1853216 RepID=UPI000E66C933|nr:ABC transporter ATP-binding protein [Salinibius halmophilus]
MLELRQLSKGYQQPDGYLSVLNNVSGELASGKSVALLGESGSGKSTLLHLIAGLDQPDSGELLINQQSMSQATRKQWDTLRRTQLSLVFQDFHLIPTLTVADNIRLQARLAGRLDEAFIAQLIERLGLGDKLKQLPDALSGGQQQRVAIARALAHRPALVLADEPTGNLDEQTAKQVMTLFLDCVKSANSSLLMVTHSPTMAQYLDQQWHLANGCLAIAGTDREADRHV